MRCGNIGAFSEGSMSITRRFFLRGMMWGACVLPYWACAELKFPGRMQVARVVFDARRHHALVFAQTARSLGAITQPFRGEPSHRECQDLFLQSKMQRKAVAGITDFTSLFLLQEMAADVGMCPVLRVHHRPHEGGHWHETFGAKTYRALGDARLADSGPRW